MSVTNDLTTDAAPLPPRDEAGKSRSAQNSDESDDDASTKKFTNSATSDTHKKSQKSNDFTPKTSGSYPVCINIVNSEGVHIGSNIKFVYKNKNKERKAKKNYDITDAVKTLFLSITPVTKKDIRFLAAHMQNEEWKNTARELGYSDGEISQFNGSHIQLGVKEVIYQFLLDWIENEADRATVQKLAKSLWDTNHNDAVIRWSKTYTTNVK